MAQAACARCKTSLEADDAIYVGNFCSFGHVCSSCNDALIFEAQEEELGEQQRFYNMLDALPDLGVGGGSERKEFYKNPQEEPEVYACGDCGEAPDIEACDDCHRFYCACGVSPNGLCRPCGG